MARGHVRFNQNFTGLSPGFQAAAGPAGVPCASGKDRRTPPGHAPMQAITKTLRTVAAMATIQAAFMLASGWLSVAMAGGRWTG